LKVEPIPKFNFLPLRGGRIEVGAKSTEWLKLNPHPGLPPARGKEQLI